MTPTPTAQHKSIAVALYSDAVAWPTAPRKLGQSKHKAQEIGRGQRVTANARSPCGLVTEMSFEEMHSQDIVQCVIYIPNRYKCEGSQGIKYERTATLSKAGTLRVKDRTQTQPGGCL